MATTSELTVSGYVRELQEIFNFEIPNDILLMITTFYPTYIQFKGNTMKLTLEEKEIITSWFMNVFNFKNDTTILTSKLLYDMNKHGRSGVDFHKNCNESKNTFSIIETEFNGHIFGCFLSKKLDTLRYKSGDYIYDDKAFLCVIRSKFFKNDPGAALFKIKHNKYHKAYYNTKKCGPSFGATDLTLLSSPGSARSQSGEGLTCFDEAICGNRLFGGEQYDRVNGGATECKITKMNTFTIDMYDTTKV